ncbi:MAG: hypothetical protein EPO07_00915 [Verrucomicrobia bacterium]|nr:MAG: hypothetical protein EPO07_00915 [Verrucomicrobiota bacterium]
MATEDQILKAVAGATPKLVQLLTSLTPEGRQRAIASALMVFGESLPQGTRQKDKGEDMDTDTPATGEGICQKAAAWMKKNNLSREQLEHVFSIDRNSIDVIASKMPQKTVSKQVVQAYVICGVAAFLKAGELAFADKDARTLCEKVGAYDQANHATYTKRFGNLITGSKDSGWKLTNPGLSEGVKIIKELAPEPTT